MRYRCATSALGVPDSNKASANSNQAPANAANRTVPYNSGQMARQENYRVQYGQTGSKTTSPWPWALAVTLLLATVGALFSFQIIPLPLPAPSADAPGTYTPPSGTPAESPDSETPSTAKLPLAIPDLAGEAELMRFFPLGDGHAWQYAEEQEHLGEDPKAGPNVMFRVVSIDRTGDRPIYRCSLNNVELFYYLRGSDLIASRSSGGPGLIQLRAPLIDGAAWEAPEGEMAWRIRRMNARVAVPAGEFECLELEKKPLNGGGSQETLYYAPGIGMVQQVTQRGMGDRTTWSLIGYVIEGASYGSMEEKPVLGDASL